MTKYIVKVEDLFLVSVHNYGLNFTSDEDQAYRFSTENAARSVAEQYITDNTFKIIQVI